MSWLLLCSCFHIDFWGFPGGYKESWVQKNWCFGTVVLEKTLESLSACKDIQRVHPKGDQSWVFIGRTNVKAETSILWPPDAKSWLIWKDPDAGKDWGQEEKGTTEDEMVGWHHQHNGHGFGWTLRVGDGQGGLACCGSWGHKELDTTEQLNWTEENPLGEDTVGIVAGVYLDSLSVRGDLRLSAFLSIFHFIPSIVDLWTTWVWTVWVYIYIDFFFFK